MFVEADSGFVEAYPLKSRSAQEAARALYFHISLFGIPRRLRVDHETEFEDEVVARCSQGWDPIA